MPSISITLPDDQVDGVMDSLLSSPRAWKAALRSLPAVPAARAAYACMQHLSDQDRGWVSLYKLCIPLLGAMARNPRFNRTNLCPDRAKITPRQAIMLILHRCIRQGWEEAAHLTLDQGFDIRKTGYVHPGVLLEHCTHIRSYSLITRLLSLGVTFHTTQYCQPYKSVLLSNADYSPDLKFAQFLLASGAPLDTHQITALEDIATQDVATRWLIAHGARITLPGLQRIVGQLSLEQWAKLIPRTKLGKVSPRTLLKLFSHPNVVAQPAHVQVMMSLGLKLPRSSPHYAAAYLSLLPASPESSSAMDKIASAHQLVMFYLDKGIPLSEFYTPKVRSHPSHYNPSEAMEKLDRFHRQQEALISQPSTPENTERMETTLDLV